MSKPPLTRMIVTVAGVLTALLVMAAVLLAMRRVPALAECTGAAAFGWTVPLVAGLVIAGVAWLLLNTDPPPHEEDAPVSCECPACGERVIRGWRLCPYCGGMLVPDGIRPEDAA